MKQSVMDLVKILSIKYGKQFEIWKPYKHGITLKKIRDREYFVGDSKLIGIRETEDGRKYKSRPPLKYKGINYGLLKVCDFKKVRDDDGRIHTIYIYDGVQYE